MPQLSWYKREEDLTRAALTPYRLLQPVAGLSYGEPDSPNMLIEGDNLDALKALLPYYAGQVKCVYIDPPFNTGQAFEHYDDNVEHSIWLGMMFPRLELLHKLLAEDGTIVVHLDDAELAYAIVIMDEIFGRKNRVSLCTFKQSSVSGPKSINPGVVSISSYLFCYSKNKTKWKSYKSYKARERDSRYSKFIRNRDQEPDAWTVISLNDALEMHFGEPIGELKRKFNVNFEKRVEKFVLENRKAVIRTARVKPKDISEEARPALLKSQEVPDSFFEAKREGLASQFFWNGEQVAFYDSKVQLINGEYKTAERVSDLWDDLLSNNLHKEGGVSFPKGKKPETLIRRVLELFTIEGDLVLDSFLGSGTTAAASHKMKRRYVGIEMGEHARTHCAKRLKAVVDGEQDGISKAENWQGGGGFRFFKLGPPVFDESGHIREGISFEHLAAHVWFSETGTARSVRALKTPFLGVHNGIGYYLLYNGILGDDSRTGGNVLTRRTLRSLPDFDGPKVIYGEACGMTQEQLDELGITFKQTPYDIKA
ncbi:site-specific DNA-methyltransferase [Pseudoalteromonas sp. GABNS16A]|uniref:site-specific DNA-methyltransferase n=3 Tax=Pseudoalteromonas TaxID=53246 RepID=UPI0023593189|nr:MULTISPECIES: site-specific DNA-methyltransferase [unclassified Pseudoalteromonas]MDC9575518.1 site-specific DNA-methyltransferase [Pseudoalteromonas sp. GABNS16A]MDC9586794.1 site-specific DNA-methyltransferase [Pseudoalteromonas sp. GABNS16C]